MHNNEAHVFFISSHSIAIRAHPYLHDTEGGGSDGVGEVTTRGGHGADHSDAALSVWATPNKKESMGAGHMWTLITLSFGIDRTGDMACPFHINQRLSLK